MKAIQILGDKKSPNIILNTATPKPTPQGAEILVRVHAAGVTGDELGWPELYQTASRIPGHELSGTVDEVGPDYTGDLVIGQEVFAFTSADRGQCQAEYVSCLPNEVAPKPASISHVEAAALPIPILTAWEAVIDHGDINADMTVLITGTSGAVGLIAVQLVAQLTGARVLALASPRHHESLRQLDADVLDYNDTDWIPSVGAVDIVIDTVGGSILSDAWRLVTEDGMIITVADPPPPWAFGNVVPEESLGRPGVRYKYFIVSPNAERLCRASGMVEAGALQALMVKSFPLIEVVRAWECSQQRGRGHKVVIDFR
ncbi:zinc-binding dehydrogenase [Colletotrichum godetiae]|uniref:Zinc-binding dehydrogenase n=1 Tax=Colletotrichum godetiae TaxID=1209918 RepID=A0AAJ0AZI7_9PEZI|nr:zinc-binding dehydrogenase [Colletotrichum godetiae]KAK1701179.1 zinc-binding dehydrogenase [Colletotrichum godetiae]